MKNLVSIVMGSQSDLEIVQEAVNVLKEFDIGFELKVLSAHRTPKELVEYIGQADCQGVKVFIAAAGMAAALPGVIAAHTPKPVIGIPIETKSLKGLDSLLSIIQMPGGIPVGCMSLGKAGAKNAALFAIEILALADNTISDKLKDYRLSQAKKILNQKIDL
jgi:5-(carboxyamino)imidazole ribonucleotide mutase